MKLIYKHLITSFFWIIYAAAAAKGITSNSSEAAYLNKPVPGVWGEALRGFLGGTA